MPEFILSNSSGPQTVYGWWIDNVIDIWVNGKLVFQNPVATSAGFESDLTTCAKEPFWALCPNPTFRAEYPIIIHVKAWSNRAPMEGISPLYLRDLDNDWAYVLVPTEIRQGVTPKPFVDVIKIITLPSEPMGTLFTGPDIRGLGITTAVSPIKDSNILSVYFDVGYRGYGAINTFEGEIYFYVSGPGYGDARDPYYPPPPESTEFRKNTKLLKSFSGYLTKEGRWIWGGDIELPSYGEYKFYWQGHETPNGAVYLGYNYIGSITIAPPPLEEAEIYLNGIYMATTVNKTAILEGLRYGDYSIMARATDFRDSSQSFNVPATRDMLLTMRRS